MLDMKELMQSAQNEICEIVDFFARDLFDVAFSVDIDNVDFEEYKYGTQYYFYYTIKIYDYRNSGIKVDSNNLLDIFEVETIKGILCYRDCFIKNEYLWNELNRVYNNLK